MRRSVALALGLLFFLSAGQVSAEPKISINRGFYFLQAGRAANISVVVKIEVSERNIQVITTCEGVDGGESVTSLKELNSWQDGSVQWEDIKEEEETSQKTPGNGNGNGEKSSKDDPDKYHTFDVSFSLSRASYVCLAELKRIEMNGKGKNFFSNKLNILVR